MLRLPFALRRFACVPQFFELVHLFDVHLFDVLLFDVLRFDVLRLDVLRSEHAHRQYAPAGLLRFDVAHLQFALAVPRRVRPNTLAWPAN